MSEKTTTGRIVAAVGGILLVVSLFLTWAGVDVDVPDNAGQFGQAVEASTSFNAFDLFGFMPFVFLLIGVLAFLPAMLDIFNLDIELPFENSLVAMVGGVLALGGMLLVLDGSGGAKIGVWIAVIGSIAITAGGFMQMNEDEAPGTYAAAPAGYTAPAPAAPSPAAPPPAAPPAAAPPAAAPPTAAPPAAAPPGAAQPPAQQPQAPQQPPQPPQPPAV